jgi:hypothetical protein
MSILEDLVLEGENLDHEASTIQISIGDSSVGINWSSKKLDQFRDKYYARYANCLICLPEDLKYKFRLAYECHKGFLESPLAKTKPIRANTHWYGSKAIPSRWIHPYETSFRNNFLIQKQVLIEASRRPTEPKAQPSIAALAIIQRLARNFHLAVHQLCQRHNKQAAVITIQDEYDVQDIFHALIIPFFDDIRPEEYCPSYAGGNSRLDFLLKAERVIIETKKTRNGLGAKEIGEQLIIDIARYRGHPICETLIAFVYDPDKKITNPKGLENDLSRISDGIHVQVIINQG